MPELEEDYFSISSPRGEQHAQAPPEAVRNEQQEQEDPPPLDESCFPGFAPFIAACQEYAKHSGCRFSIKAFEGIELATNTRVPIVNDKRSRDAGPLLLAKLKAMPSICSFMERLRNGE